MPRSARLLKAEQFDAAFGGRRVGRTSLLSLHMAPAAEPALGMVIGRRMAPRAVTRNTVKRVIREAFRLKRPDLPPAHYVFRLHSRVGDISLRALRRQVRCEADDLLTRAMRRKGAESGGTRSGVVPGGAPIKSSARPACRAVFI